MYTPIPPDKKINASLETLSRTKIQVMRKIEEMGQQNGWDPSSREVNSALGKSSSGTISSHVKRLVKMGLVIALKPSGLRLTKKGREELYRRLKNADMQVLNELEEVVTVKDRMIGQSLIKVLDELEKIGKLSDDDFFRVTTAKIESEYGKRLKVARKLRENLDRAPAVARKSTSKKSGGANGKVDERDNW